MRYAIGLWTISATGPNEQRSVNGSCWPGLKSLNQHYANVVACSPCSVYRVLRDAGVLNPRGKESKKGKGFQQPLTAHQHWHVDVAYINICIRHSAMSRLSTCSKVAKSRSLKNATANSKRHDTFAPRNAGRKNWKCRKNFQRHRGFLRQILPSAWRIGQRWEAPRAPDGRRRQNSTDNDAGLRPANIGCLRQLCLITHPIACRSSDSC